VLSKDEVKNIAALARIGLTEQEIEKYQKDLSAILDWIEQLKEVDISGAEPTAHITGMNNIMREDKAVDFGNSEDIKKLFPEEKNGYDKVKTVF
jgi:aspartyl-tRNA(Asn)/glutamyl-tRNA(Gln) amidotransferase subunit C